VRKIPTEGTDKFYEMMRVKINEKEWKEVRGHSIWLARQMQMSYESFAFVPQTIWSSLLRAPQKWSSQGETVEEVAYVEL